MISRLLKDTITHWAKSGINGFNESTFGTPTTLTGRWQDKNELFINALGKETMSTAVIYLPSDVSAGDYLYLGTSIVADPDDVTGAFEVVKVGKTSNVRNTEALVRVWL